MIKQIQIKNFESHKNTVVNFEAGFNLIVGPSNSGKSSILRAAKLVAYSDWNPQSLRVGCKTTNVTMTTDKGVVSVKRGKSINEWEVTPEGCEKKEFSRPGKTIVEDAAAVIGLRTVKLGTQDVRPNIMDQLEGHFMLDEVEGQSESGSGRAQIIDEISGLAGMEEIVRDVNLDNVRNAREIKESEVRANETTDEMHDQNAIDAETAVLDAAEKAVLSSKAASETARAAADALDALNEATASVSAAVGQLKAMPDVSKAEKHVSAADKALKSASDAQTALDGFLDLGTAVSGLKVGLADVPDLDQALSLVDMASDARKAASLMTDDLSSHVQIFNSINDEEVSLSVIEKELSDLVSECDTIMDEIEICPICLGAKHDGCGEGQK